MKPVRHTGTRTLWLGPKSLAIVSCALALLAAQPVMAAATDAKPTAIRVSGPSPSAETAPRFLIRTDAAQPRPSFTTIDTANLSTRQLHVLATVEILQRLLAFNLRPVDRDTLPVLLFVPDTLAFIQNIALPMQITCDVPAPALKPREQAYALTHCLLAPPTIL